MSFDLVVIGHLLKEKIIFSDGKEIGPVLGSPAAYASVAAAKLGLKTGLVTKIGTDMPEELLRVFGEAGVDTEGLKMGDNTTTNHLIYEKSGSKKLQFLKKADGIYFEDIPKKYLEASFFLIAPIDYEVPLSLIKSLHGEGKRLSMELGGYGGASSSKAGDIPNTQRADFIKEMAPCFDIVKGGQEDCQCLFGNDLFEAKEIPARFVEWGTRISIITLGEKGAIAAVRDSAFSLSSTVYRFPSFPAKVVDCTGAGDVFHAGFLAEYLMSNDLQKSTKFALATASLVIENTGGVTLSRMPTREQVLKRTGGK